MDRSRQLKQRMQSALSRAGTRGMRRLELFAQLGEVPRDALQDAFQELLLEHRVVPAGDGHFLVAPKAIRVSGVFHRNPKGFGFVTPAKGGEDIFVQVDQTEGALSGDQVLVAVHPVRDARGPSGTILRIERRSHSEAVGVLTEERSRSGARLFRPLRRDLPPLLEVSTPEAELTGIATGDWVVGTLRDPEADESLPTVDIRRRLGRQATIASDLNAICEEFNIPRKYDRRSEAHAAALPEADVPREDCLALDIFTCDPMDARDFDDAISLEAGSRPGEVVLGVHIADVACIVQQGKVLDRAARGRGFTTYLPGRTIGMLPDALSNDRCSLREGVERLAHSVFLTVDEGTGEILSSRRVHTRIRSRHRLCYEQVDRVLAGEGDPRLSGAFCAKLRRANALAERMRELRARREAFLPLDVPEVRVLCTGSPVRMVGLQRSHVGPSSLMIEEFMLAANVRVAMELRERQIPGFYRNHEAPAPESLREFARQAAELAGGKPVKWSSREALAQYLKRLHAVPGGELLCIQLLRKMPRAEYGVGNAGHYGLGKEVYCHFTSPIRRYADLLVHQQLLAFDMRRPPAKAAGLAGIGESLNALEMEIDQAGFAASDRLKLRYLQEAECSRRCAACPRAVWESTSRATA